MGPVILALLLVAAPETDVVRIVKVQTLPVGPAARIVACTISKNSDRRLIYKLEEDCGQPDLRWSMGPDDRCAVWFNQAFGEAPIVVVCPSLAGGSKVLLLSHLDRSLEVAR